MAAWFLQASSRKWILLECASRPEPYLYNCNSNHIDRIPLVMRKSNVLPVTRQGMTTGATLGPVIHDQLWLTENLLCTGHYARHFPLVISLSPQTILWNEYHESYFVDLQIETQRNWCLNCSGSHNQWQIWNANPRLILKLPSALHTSSFN